MDDDALHDPGGACGGGDAGSARLPRRGRGKRRHGRRPPTRRPRPVAVRRGCRAERSGRPAGTTPGRAGRQDPRPPVGGHPGDLHPGGAGRSDRRSARPEAARAGIARLRARSRRRYDRHRHRPAGPTHVRAAGWRGPGHHHRRHAAFPARQWSVADRCGGRPGHRRRLAGGREGRSAGGSGRRYRRADRHAGPDGTWPGATPDLRRARRRGGRAGGGRAVAAGEPDAGPGPGRSADLRGSLRATRRAGAGVAGPRRGPDAARPRSAAGHRGRRQQAARRVERGGGGGDARPGPLAPPRAVPPVRPQCGSPRTAAAGHPRPGPLVVDRPPVRRADPAAAAGRDDPVGSGGGGDAYGVPRRRRPTTHSPVDRGVCRVGRAGCCEWGQIVRRVPGHRAAYRGQRPAPGVRL